MRVTNERAQSAIKAHHITGNLTKIVKDYATDLLDARDIIEKQTELIKEMRGELEQVIQEYICEPCCKSVASKCNTCEGSCGVVCDSKDILDRTKEYAE